MSDKILLTRNQIAKIVNNNPEAIKAFENLFKIATQQTPNDAALLMKLSEEASLDGNSAMVKAMALHEKVNRQLAEMLSVTASTSLPSKSLIVLSNATSGNISVTLPNPLQTLKKTITITKVDTTVNTVTILPFGIELVAGEASQVLLLNGESLTLISDGTNWEIGG